METCEKCRECTLFGKNLEPAKTFKTAQSLPSLSGPNQELQLDFASRSLQSLLLNFLAHQLRFIRRPRIVPLLHLLPILSKNFLASALPIRELLFLRRKFCLHRALFIFSFRVLRDALILSVAISPRSTSG